MMRTLMTITIGLLLAGFARSATCQAEPAASDAGTTVKKSATTTTSKLKKKTLSADKEAKAAPASKDKELVWAGATIRLGMTKAEALAQMEKTPKGKWFAVELDGPPYGELHKMDKWVIAYGDPSLPDQGGGVVTMSFTGDRLTKMVEGNQP